MYILPEFLGISLCLLLSPHAKEVTTAEPWLRGLVDWSIVLYTNQQVLIAGLIRGQGSCLGCRPSPQWGTNERQPVSVYLSLPSSLLL